MDEIFQRQREFQETTNVGIDDSSKKDFLSEVFLFKAIEEIIELRKEFPSGLNKNSKTMKEADDNRIYEELSDVLLFLVNFMIVRGLDVNTLYDKIGEVQNNNFDKLHEKK